jgi:outer membrane murein-binding lipoprotein Lpp
MTKMILGAALCCLALTGCVSREQRIEAAQSDCQSMGYGGQALSDCTYGEVEAGDARRAAAASMLLGYSLQQMQPRPSVTCTSNAYGAGNWASGTTTCQ